jgi:hypothetical protein
MNNRIHNSCVTAKNGFKNKPLFRKLISWLIIILALLFPIIFVLGLELYIKFYPHVVKLTTARYLLSFAFLFAILFVFLAIRKRLKSIKAKVLILLPVVVIYIFMAFLVTIRSSCDPYWYGEEFDDGMTPTDCAGDAPCKDN